MSGLSRREFLAAVTALASAYALPTQLLGSAMAAPALPANIPTTLLETIRFGPIQQGQYRSLVTAPGEPYLPRYDILGRAAAPGRATARRSIAYLGHFSDMHVIDAQSPGRLEPLLAQDSSLWAGTLRPQDTLTVHVNAAMTRAVAEASRSPLTGAPMTAAVVTGDSADMMSSLELQWYIDTLDGATITPNSGASGIYEGVQAWIETTYAYQPGSPGGVWSEFGFPQLPGMLTAAVSQPVSSVGLPVPWYSVFGNHDTTMLGTFAANDQWRAWAVGDRKFASWPSLGFASFLGQASQASAFTALFDRLLNNVGLLPGVKAVTPDSGRGLFTQVEFMQAHLDSPATPGPVGHGFTPRNVQTGETWWAADAGPFVRLLGLDTCNPVAGPDGAVPRVQLDWLVGELTAAQSNGRLCVILSHHNSLTLENTAVLEGQSSDDLVHAEEFIATLNRFPNVVAWLNGHTHINTIQAHPREGGGGFWEITAASCIDFPQQQQTVEIVDNRDGTISLFTTVLDHRAPASYTSGDYSVDALASLSRQLAANNMDDNGPLRLGSEMDRNTELLLPAPFDMSSIGDAAVEAAQAEALARVLAHEQAAAK